MFNNILLEEDKRVSWAYFLHDNPLHLGLIFATIRIGFPLLTYLFLYTDWHRRGNNRLGIHPLQGIAQNRGRKIVAPIEKVVIVLSGGADSSTLAYWAKSKGYEIYPISFNYGQIASKETKNAKVIAGKLGVKIKVINVSSLKQIFKGSTVLVDRSMIMPAQFESKVIVPFRNAIFLSIAVAYAISIGSIKLMYGAHKSDEPFYPDCRKEFVDAFQNVAKIGTAIDMTIENPFYKFSKAEIIRIGTTLRVPYKLTWSCYLDGEYHCGDCESCVNRKNAFKEARISDPTRYES